MRLIKNKNSNDENIENDYYNFEDDRIICSCTTMNDEKIVYAHYSSYLASLSLTECTKIDAKVNADARFIVANTAIRGEYISMNCGADILLAEHFFGLKLSTNKVVEYYSKLYEASHKKGSFDLHEYLICLKSVLTQMADEHGILILSNARDRQEIANNCENQNNR